MIPELMARSAFVAGVLPLVAVAAMLAGSAGDARAWDPTGFRKPADADLKRTLGPLQYDVTQHAATEPSFHNEYWDNHREGIYVDVVSGEPLFSSLDKYDSGTGWPSFSKALEPGNIRTKADWKFFVRATEVRSAHADSHLGHVFDDWPPPTGLRYCMNYASLRFVPKEDLEREGYGEYVRLFDSKRPAVPTRGK